MIKVLKFGGTSVGSAANMKKVAEIVRREQARITVLSAMSGTTDSLVRISRAAASGDRNAIEEQLAMLTDKYTRCIEELLRERKQQALARMNATFGLIRDEAAAFEEYESERKIIAQGELLTSAIFTAYLQETGLKAECLYSPDFMVKDPGEKVDTEPVSYTHLDVYKRQLSPNTRLTLNINVGKILVDGKPVDFDYDDWNEDSETIDFPIVD